MKIKIIVIILFLLVSCRTPLPLQPHIDDAKKIYDTFGDVYERS